VALVTGGTRGIGAAICHELADQGAHVAAGFWHDHEAAEKFLADTAAAHPDQRVTVHEGNIGNADDCRRMLHEREDQHGRVDILVNNAGITIDRTVAKMTDEDWQKVIAVTGAPRPASTRAHGGKAGPRGLTPGPERTSSRRPWAANGTPPSATPPASTCEAETSTYAAETWTGGSPLKRDFGTGAGDLRPCVCIHGYGGGLLLHHRDLKNA
jgi:short chain dehydrogenase